MISSSATRCGRSRYFAAKSGLLATSITWSRTTKRQQRKKRQAPTRVRDDEDERGYEDEDDLVGPRRVQAPRLRRGRGRGGERESLRALVRDIPSFVKLLGRLARGPRVSAADKAIVLAAIGYLFLPADLIPDWIPALGEVEDVLVLALALSRLLNSAGIDALMDQWDGDMASLESALSALNRATSLLPGPVRRLLGGRR
jgi:uncharacterized membrane protein YkvA (DUF1232 family)